MTILIMLLASFPTLLLALGTNILGLLIYHGYSRKFVWFRNRHVTYDPVATTITTTSTEMANPTTRVDLTSTHASTPEVVSNMSMEEQVLSTNTNHDHGIANLPPVL